MAAHKTCDACGAEMGVNGAGTSEGASHFIHIEPMRNNPNAKECYVEWRSFSGNYRTPKGSDDRADICLTCALRAALNAAQLMGVKLQ